MTLLAEAVDKHPTSRARWRMPVGGTIVALLFLAGVMTILYPSTAGWINQYQESQMIRDYSGEIGQLAPTDRTVALERAREYNQALTTGAVVGALRNVPESSDGDGVDSDYWTQLRASGSSLMGRVKVPAIDVDLPIYHGTSEETLLRGVGHLQGTALPVGGETAHSVLTAHRGLASAELFTNLDRVVVGDQFTVEVFGEVLTYEVRQVQVVEPHETESLFPVLGEDFVTLVTCTPLGINTQRILVTGERVTPTPIEDIVAQGRAPEIPGFPWWALGLGGAVLFAGGYVGWTGRSRARDLTRPSATLPS